MGDYLMSYIAIGGRQKKTLGKMGNLGIFVKFLLVLVFGVVVELFGISGQSQRSVPGLPGCYAVEFCFLCEIKSTRPFYRAMQALIGGFVNPSSVPDLPAFRGA